MYVHFWGTRGSIPRPVPETLRYGGNTSCVEVRSRGGTLVVLDCGSGAYDLGQALVSAGEAGRGHLFITHTHWDHIQGFPFFAPLFIPGAEWDIYGPGGLGERLEATLGGQMSYTYFPIALDQLGATIRFHDLTEGSLGVGDLTVVAKYLNHPALALGYRLEAGGASLVYAVDHEPYAWSAGSRRAPVEHAEERRHLEFLQNAGLVIHDTQYTDAEYPKHIGWGHSTAEYAVDMASAAGARRLALFHHDPQRRDEALQRVAGEAQERAARKAGLEVFAAAQGETLELAEESHQARQPVGAQDARQGSLADCSGAPKTVLVGDADPDTLALLRDTLRGFRLLSALDGEEALSLARRERPDLVLLDWQLPRLSTQEVCRALRSGPDAALREVPIVVVGAPDRAPAIPRDISVAITDYLIKPFIPSHLRSRVRTWLLRAG